MDLLDLVWDPESKTISFIGGNKVFELGNLFIMGEYHKEDGGRDAEIYPLEAVLSVGTGR